MAANRQIRVQLSFRPGDERQMQAYRYLRGRADKTDYIVHLILADLAGGPAGRAAAPPPPEKPEIDYQKLVELLQPRLSGLVSETLRRAFMGGMGGVPAPPEPVVPAAPAAPEAPAVQAIPIVPAPVPASPQGDDLTLALEGLKLFG